MKTTLLSLTLAAGAVWAQPAANPKPAVVTGKVVNAVTGEPLRKATLTISTQEDFGDLEGMVKEFGLDLSGIDLPDKPKTEAKTFSAVTDATGKFRFEAVDPGDYHLTVKHAGFVDQTYSPPARWRVEGFLHLAAAQELTDLEFRMVPHGALSGRVVDEDGDPAPNALVTALTVRYMGGKRKLTPADASPTNDRGEFRLGKLPPGRYYLCADVMSTDMFGKPPAPPQDGSPETAYTSTFFPKSSEIGQAQVMDVKPAADITGLNIQMQKSLVVRVKGKALGPDGKPLKAAQVMLMSGARPGSMRMTPVTAADGSFELVNVAPGTYTAMTIQMTGAAPSMNMQVLIVPNRNLENVKLGAQTEGTLEGKVVVNGGGTISVKGIGVMLQGDETASLMPATGMVEESGTFRIAKVAHAAYSLMMPGVPPGAYLKSILWNGRDILGGTLDLSTGTAGDLQVVLGTDGGHALVRVMRDEKPLADAKVVLLPVDAARRFTETVHGALSDEAGQANFKDVAPGDYLILAWERIDDDQWFDPDFVKLYQSQAARVTIRPKDNRKVDIQPAVPPK